MLLNCGVGEDSPWDSKEIQPANPKGNQSWIFIGKTDAEAEIPILWPPNSKNWFIGEDRDARKDWRQKEKVRTEDEMVGWHQRLDGQEFGQAMGIGDGQGILALSSLWGHKESDTTEWLNWTEHDFKGYFSFTDIPKYGLHSLCCEIYPWAYLTSNSLYFPLFYVTLGTTSLFSISVSLLLFCYIH